ncbi:putative nucleotidyltransferase substrate binding domain-containing protein [Malonomonas rubra]|uniref:putative nucleotidyltransferase substrate binding domain-containing protein n=1 Tax=Malonomonas rubra TaxID=57040 RepID=UPI0026EAE5C4|nr:putative nucleotidyltransferase substrate binding domain-containing protein [Malonomonas rubra]
MGIIHLRDSEPFCHLPEVLFQELRESAVKRTFGANIHIVNQHDQPTGFLYVIMEGMVEITTNAPGGEEMVVDYRKEGQFFGGTPIFTGEPYTGGVRTVTPTTCYLLPEKALKKVAKGYPQVSEYFTRMMLSRVRSLYAEIVKEHTSNAVTQMEAYPFKKRLSEIMSSPVETCGPDTSARDVARQMTEKAVSSVLVVDAGGHPIGIITERDLIAKVISPDDTDCDVIPAAEVMTAHPHSVSPQTYMYEAMAYITAHGIKHLPVVDDGQLVGIVTMRELMRYRSQKAMLLVGSVNEETTLEGLASTKREILTVARALLTETHSTPEVMEIISYIHHSIIKKVYQICFKEMLAEGYQRPTVRYCFLLMGSGGRREMLLNPDQDNGFIFEDVSDERLPEIEQFFVPFSEKLVAALAKVGYPLCEGKVMCNNPMWRGRLIDWHKRIHDWVQNPEPQKVRYSSIFFDFVPLEGDSNLAQALHDIVFSEIRRFEGFLYHMMSLDLRYKVPVGLLGRFIVAKDGEHKGLLSVKQGGSIYIVDCTRMFVLEKGIQQTTTQDRLNMLVKRKVFETDTAEHIKAALEALNFLRLRNEIVQLENGQKPSHYLDPFQLSKSEQELLKEAFHVVSKLQDATKRHFSKSYI